MDRREGNTERGAVVPSTKCQGKVTDKGASKARCLTVSQIISSVSQSTDGGNMSCCFPPELINIAFQPSGVDFQKESK